MSTDRGSDLWLLLPRPIRQLPADLASVAILVVLTNVAVFAPVVSDTPIRAPLGLAFVLFAPGYAFVAALFPEAGASPVADRDADDDDDDGYLASRDGGIDGIERVALSFGLSIAIVPLIGLVLNFTPFGIRLVPIVVSLSVFTVLATSVGAYRRWDLPEDERFRVPYREWIADARSEMLEPDSRADAVLNVLLVVSILLAAVSVGYAALVPQTGESFTELYLLTEGEDGQLVAADYPQAFTVGESKPVVIGIGNQEHATTDYSVVVELHQVVREPGPNNTTRIRVTDEDELRRFSARLGHNETWLRTYNVTPTMTGQRMRLAFLLYRGDPPAEPTVENAYRETHLFVNVTGGGQSRVGAVDDRIGIGPRESVVGGAESSGRLGVRRVTTVVGSQGRVRSGP